MAERLGTQLQSGGLEQSIHTGLLGSGLFGGASLDLNFAVTKNVGPLVSFTRASSATYIDSAGTLQTAAVDVPRFDHNPTTGESLGLLVEEQRTNLLVNSEDAAARWPTKALVTVSSNTISAPDGIVTADSCIETATLGDHYLESPLTQTANTALSFSIFVKPLGSARATTIVMFANSYADSSSAAFNLSTATVNSVNKTGTGAVPTASIQQLANGWLRLSISGQPTTAAVTDLKIRVQLINVSTTYTGDGTSGIYIWGAQLEAGAFPTSYIPTTTAAATRSADVASITGANFSSWYRQDEGTVFADITRQTTTGFPGRVRFWDGTAANIIDLYYDAAVNSSTFEIKASSTSSVQIFGGGVALNSPVRAAAGWQTNNAAVIYNSSILGTDSSVVVPVVDQMRIATGLTGTIKRLTFWPQRLPNSTLVALTQ